MNDWHWGVFLQDPGGGYSTYGMWLLSAWGWTVAVALSALLISLVMGSIIGVMRTLPKAKVLVCFANIWVELFRNVPLLVQIFLWYYVAPEIFPWMGGVSPFWVVVMALGLFTSARIAEQVRAAIQSLPRGQWNAASALGLTTFQTYRHVLLPLAYRIIIPPLTSEAMGIFKNSAIAFTVSVPELTQFYLQAGEETARQSEIFIAVVFCYALSALVINACMNAIERGLRLPGLSGK